MLPFQVIGTEEKPQKKGGENINMMNKKLASAIATGALLLNSALPAFAVTLEVSGNGSDSQNTTGVAVTTTTTVVQNNTANVSNNVNASAKTGGNAASDNTGGDVNIQTGDADVAVGIQNSVNSNVAEVDGCCDLDADVLISGNGSKSDNNVELGLANVTGVFQTNAANLNNNVDAKAKTGENYADDNTGADVLVRTGDATVTTVIENTANANSATVGGHGNGGSVSARVLGNGTESDNDIELGVLRSLEVVQDNYANLSNDVDADAKTGANSADDNTGGLAAIVTGDADVMVGIDNMVNFNSANLDCDCLLDVTAKISGNGSDSENDIAAELVDSRAAFQDNVWACNEGREYLNWYGYRNGGCNDVNADAHTGWNDVDDSTSYDGSDPVVVTGDADSEVVIENAGNSNVLGDTPSMPDFDWDFDLGGMNWLLSWGWFGAHMG